VICRVASNGKRSVTVLRPSVCLFRLFSSLTFSSEYSEDDILVFYNLIFTVRIVLVFVKLS